MIRKLTGVVILTAAILSVALPVHATAIIDTGAPTTSGGSSLANFGGFFSWLAAEFTVSESWIVTDLQGWIDPISSGDVRIRLYSDGGDFPFIPVFEATVFIPGTGPTGWYGPSGLNSLMGPGTYWIGFEVFNAGFQGSMPFPAPSPLGNEAVLDSFAHPVYTGIDNIDMGVRILGNRVADPVPEPTSLLLLGSGLVGASVRRYLRRR